jgi:hypothetical protein
MRKYCGDRKKCGSDHSYANSLYDGVMFLPSMVFDVQEQIIRSGLAAFFERRDRAETWGSLRLLSMLAMRGLGVAFELPPRNAKGET